MPARLGSYVLFVLLHDSMIFLGVSCSLSVSQRPSVKSLKLSLTAPYLEVPGYVSDTEKWLNSIISLCTDQPDQAVTPGNRKSPDPPSS